MSDENAAKPSFFKKLFADFDWGRFAGAVAVGASVGGAYSVFDQTVLHRKKVGEKLPLPTEKLQRLAPDILKALDKFYRYRTTVPTQQHKDAFKHFTKEVMVQSEYIAALYWECMSNSASQEIIDPEMTIIARFNQMKKHMGIVFEALRRMRALVENPEAEQNVELVDSFNRLYECYNNRLFNIEKLFK